MNHGNYGKIKKKQSESYIVKTLNNFSKYLYHSLIYGFFGKFMTSYISIDNLFDKSLIKLSASREKYSNGESKKKHSAFENSIMVSLFGKFGTHFMRTDFSSYIVFIVSYCLSALVGDILRLYFNNELILLETLKKAAVIFIIITGVVICSFIASEKSLGELISKSKILQLIFGKLFGIGDEYYYNYKNKAEKHIGIALCTGILLGFTSYFISPAFLWIFIVTIIVAWIIFSLPETGIILVLLVTPFLAASPNIGSLIIVPMILTEISYFIKVTRKKRTFSFGVADLSVALIALIIFFGFITPSGNLLLSFFEVIKYLIVVLMYFPIKNLINERKWVLKSLSALLLSAFVIASFGIVQFITGRISPETAEYMFKTAFTGCADVFFNNNTTLGIYLATIVVMSLAIPGRNNFKHHILTYGAIAIISICIVCTCSGVAITGLCLGVVMLLLVNSHKSLSGVILAMAPAALILTFVIPFLTKTSADASNVISSMSNQNSISSVYRLDTWSGSILMIKDNWFYGIGIGSFENVFPSYALRGTENSVNCGSLYLDVLVQLGVVGLLMLICVIFLHIQNGFTYIKKSDDKDISFILKCVICSLGILTVLGLVNSVWYNNGMLLMFFAICALINSITNIGYTSIGNEQNQIISTPREAYIRLYIA